MSANPEWTTVPLAEPWHRDAIAGLISQTTSEYGPGLNAWSMRIVDCYGRNGTLEVSACILALRAEIAALRGSRNRVAHDALGLAAEMFESDGMADETWSSRQVAILLRNIQPQYAPAAGPEATP